MKNKEIYVLKVEECSKKKIELDLGAKIVLRNIKKIFNKVTKFEPKYIKKIIDLEINDFDDGEEEKKSKMIDLLDFIGVMFVVYKLTGKETKINNYLSDKYGISIKENSQNTVNDRFNAFIADNDDITDLWLKSITGYDLPEKSDEILKILVKEGLNVLLQINDTNNEIKNVEALDVQEKCEIKKGNFVKAVDLKTKEVKNGKDKVIEKIKEIDEDYINFKDATEFINE